MSLRGHNPLQTGEAIIANNSPYDLTYMGTLIKDTAEIHPQVIIIKNPDNVTSQIFTGQGKCFYYKTETESVSILAAVVSQQTVSLSCTFR